MEYSIQLGGMSTVGPVKAAPHAHGAPFIGLSGVGESSMTAASNADTMRRAEELLGGLSDSDSASETEVGAGSAMPAAGGASSGGEEQKHPEASPQASEEGAPSKPGGLFASVMAAARSQQN
jgi:hypothetical protein